MRVTDLVIIISLETVLKAKAKFMQTFTRRLFFRCLRRQLFFSHERLNERSIVQPQQFVQFHVTRRQAAAGLETGR